MKRRTTKMSSIDNFWRALRDQVNQATSMAPVAASRMICDFIANNYDRWRAEQTQIDIEINPDLSALVDRACEIRNAPTAEATSRWEHRDRAAEARDQEVADLANNLYYAARAGRAAAEHNLAAAGMIEMIGGHVAGLMRYGDNFWDGLRWTLTDLGRRTSNEQLAQIVTRDPPLDVARWDADDEADDVAGNCGNEDDDSPMLATHRRIADFLAERVDRIRREIAQGGTR
jgi:hypothetical protein